MKHKSTKLELLSPVGDMTMLKAAITNGADAVYCGLDRFSARAKAVNFDLATMIEAIQYAHSFGVKVYVAINTLIYDRELADAVSLAATLHKANVDAIIVQDLGLVKRLREELPEMTLHASTQMGIHNLEGVKFAESLGIKRVILSRETTLDDIKRIRDNSDIELEFFAHGALCVSFSGNCYLSGILTRQSGNRGRCLQLCRKEYFANGQKARWLSAKDIDMSGVIGELSAAGITSFKIEGRLRTPEYVASVTSVYRRILDGQKIDKTELSKHRIRGGGCTAHLFNTNTDTICEIKTGRKRVETYNRRK